MSRPFGAFPFQPLHEVLVRHLPEISDDRGGFIAAGDLSRASDLLDVCRRVLVRWKAGQLLTLAAADRCATSLGLDARQIWFDFDDICDRLDREAEERLEARRVHDVERNRAARARRLAAA